MRLVRSLRIAHDNCPSGVFWPTPHQDNFNQERRVLAAGWTATAGAPSATVAVAAGVVTTEAPTGTQVGEVAPVEAAAGIVAPTAAPEAEEEALEVVATLGAAEPPARGTAGMGDVTTPQATATEATGDTRTEAPTELAAPAPRRTAARVPMSLS